MSEPKAIRYYRGRRIAWNSVNRLWWIKITTEEGRKESRCRNTYATACKLIDWDIERLEKK